MNSIKLFSIAMLSILWIVATGHNAQIASAQADCTVLVQPHQSIQQAVNSAVEGAVICLSPGTFKETIKINKSLTLRGAGMEDTTIKSEVTVLAVVHIESDANIGVGITDLAIAGFEQTDGIYISGDGQARVTLRRISIFDNGGDGLFIDNSAQVSLINSQISGNGAGGIFLFARKPARINIQNSQVSDSFFYGLVVDGASQATLIDSVISSNRLGGILILESANVQVQASIIKDNGIGYPCSLRNWFCNGIEIRDQAHLMLDNSSIKDNADWGVGAFLVRCGYSADSFTGQIIFQGRTRITGNNRMGNLDNKDNPGNHPFKDLTDGQVCLP